MVDLSKQARGAWGEQRAARWYQDAGYTILERNWRTRTGEIDLIARNNDEIVFCEVKARRSNSVGAASEAVNWRKQKRIRTLAAQWLKENNHHGQVRFDVVAITGNQINVIEAAF